MSLLASITATTNGLAKMKLTGYKDLACSQEVENIELQVNPSQISVKYAIKHPDPESTDTNPVSTGDSTYELPGLDIETTVDATGVYYKSLKDLGSDDVSAYISKLKKVVYNYVDETHGPPYVAIHWGSVAIESTHLASGNSAMFKGQLESLEVEYQLFSLTGKPIRAKVKMTFRAMIDPAFRPTGNSPDLTHVHQVQMGDNLPALSKKIYNDPNFYMQLARVNGLSSVYQLKPGVQLVIPPLEKSSR